MVMLVRLTPLARLRLSALDMRLRLSTLDLRLPPSSSLPSFSSTDEKAADGRTRERLADPRRSAISIESVRSSLPPVSRRTWENMSMRVERQELGGCHAHHAVKRLALTRVRDRFSRPGMGDSRTDSDPPPPPPPPPNTAALPRGWTTGAGKTQQHQLPPSPLYKAPSNRSGRARCEGALHNLLQVRLQERLELYIRVAEGGAVSLGGPLAHPPTHPPLYSNNFSTYWSDASPAPQSSAAAARWPLSACSRSAAPSAAWRSCRH